MSRGKGYGFTDEELGLSSAVTLVRLIQGLSEPEEPSEWSTYLTSISLMPDVRPRPTHPLCLPLAFPADGPPQPLTSETAESMEHRFAVLRSIWKQLEDSMSGSGEPDAALVNELGPQALAAVRGLGDDLEVERFDHGEIYVMALKLRAAIPLESVRHARLIQILDRIEHLYEADAPRPKSVGVFAARLIYRLPVDSGIRPLTCAGIEELDRTRERIEHTFVDLFPGNHAVVELRDCDGATVRWGPVVGPPYDQVKQKQDEWRQKAKQS